MSGRKAIGKRLRFEVFKRDKFRCVYCGATPPDAVLHIDHVVPVSDGGSNDPLNLVTACAGCNLGKSNIRLDDRAEMRAQRDRLEDLHDRKEQLEAMLEWRAELADFEEYRFQSLADQVERHLGQRQLSPTGRARLVKFLRSFEDDDVFVKAVAASSEQYLEFTDDGDVTHDSAERYLAMLPRVARAMKSGRPEAKRVAYIGGILRNRLNYLNYDLYKRLLWRCIDLNVDLDGVEQFAKDANSWTEFKGALERFLEVHDNG